MFDAAGQGLQQAGHRAPRFQCTICCSMERALKATRSMLTDASSVTHIWMAQELSTDVLSQARTCCFAAYVVTVEYFHSIVMALHASAHLRCSCTGQSIGAPRQASYDHNRPRDTCPYGCIYSTTPGSGDALMCNSQRS